MSVTITNFSPGVCGSCAAGNSGATTRKGCAPLAIRSIPSGCWAGPWVRPSAAHATPRHGWRAVSLRPGDRFEHVWQELGRQVSRGGVGTMTGTAPAGLGLVGRGAGATS